MRLKISLQARSTGGNRAARRWRRGLSAVACLAPAALLGSVSARAQTGTVDFTANQQKVEGFGFSQAFGASQSVGYLPAALQTQVWDLMFNPQTGAGLDVLRLGIDTDSQIEPTSPGSPTATPTYVFDGSDGKQVQTAQIAQHYGVNDFFATSWSAPGFMKTNGSLINGGSLCGVSGTIGAGVTNSCNGQDWRQPYANLLVQYVKDYAGVGVPITALDFQNEPDFAAQGYASETFTPAQMADFVGNAFGPTMRAQLPAVRTMCCDAFNWASQFSYTGTFPYYGNVGQYIDIVTAHEYGYPAKTPQNTTKPVWMTEWATLSTTDELRWDAGGTGDSDGMYLANDIIQAFNAGNVDVYNYWWGAVNQANALVRVYICNFQGYYMIPGRYYAMAALSRYVRPGAYRVATVNTNSNLDVVAFRNTDGSKVMEVLNTGTAATTAGFTVDPDTAQSTVKTFLTDQTHSINETDSAVIANGSLSLSLPPRSLTTLVLPPAMVNGPVNLQLSTTLRRLGDGSFEDALQITNAGTGTATGMVLATATLGSVQATPNPVQTLPVTAGMGSLAPGGTMLVPLNFAAGAGSSGSNAVVKITGSYAGGAFGGSMRVVLP